MGTPYPLTNHPHINRMVNLFEKEEQPFRKIHRMIDLFETIIKTHTAVLIGNYIQENHISDGVKGLLAEGLRTPSLGLWQYFSRVIYDELMFNHLLAPQFEKLEDNLKDEHLKRRLNYIYKKDGDFYTIQKGISRKELTGSIRTKITAFIKNQDPLFPNRFFVPNFLDYFYKWDKMVDNVINKRNFYAHGATPDDYRCTEDLNELKPLLIKWLDADWLKETTIIVPKAINPLIILPIDESIEAGQSIFNSDRLGKSLSINHPYLVNRDGDFLDLFPILGSKYYTQSEASLIFFNDLKKYKIKKVSYLNYPYAEHILDSDIYNDFISIMDIEKWKNKNLGEFRERIQELSINFRGRKSELGKINGFIQSKSKGFLYLFGHAGVGKSAVIANALYQEKEITASTFMIKYFIRRGTRYAEAGKFLDYLNQNIEEVCQSKIPFGETIEEKESNLHFRLQFFSDFLVERKQKCAIFIDGLDEAIDSGQSKSLFFYLLKETYQNVLVIYTSRPLQQTNEFYNRLPIEFRDTFSLSGLSKEYIRSLLYEILNKYEIDRDEPAIDIIREKSEGNPLYLKLLCMSIENKQITLSQVNQLPGKMEEFYKGMLLRFAKLPFGNNLYDILFLFASAKDDLSITHIRLMLGLNTAEVEYIVLILQEILVESTEYPNHYRLFHGSLREYLQDQRKNECIDAEWQILNFCKDWKKWLHYDGIIHTYALKYYSRHLIDTKNVEEFKKLVQDEVYIDAQISYTGDFSYSFDMLESYMRTIDIDNDQIYLLAIKMAKLHIRLDNRVNDWLAKVMASPARNIEEQLNQLQLYKPSLQLAIYLHLLYRLIDSKGDNDKIALILKHMDHYFIADVTLLNLINYSNPILLFDVMVKLKQNHHSPQVILKRTKFNIGSLKKLLPFICWDSAIECELASQIVQSIETSFERAESLIQISLGLFSIGKINQGIELINETQTQPTEPKSKIMKIKVFVSLAKELAEKGTSTYSQRILEEAVYIGQTLPILHNGKAERTEQLLFIVNNTVEIGMFELAYNTISKAEKAANAIPDNHHRIFKVRLQRHIYQEKTKILNSPQVNLAKNTMQKRICNTSLAEKRVVTINDILLNSKSKLEIPNRKALFHEVSDDIGKLKRLDEIDLDFEKILNIDEEIITYPELILDANFDYRNVKEGIAKIFQESPSRTGVGWICKLSLQLYKHGYTEEAIHYIRRTKKITRLLDEDGGELDRPDKHKVSALRTRAEALFTIVHDLCKHHAFAKALVVAKKISVSYVRAAAYYTLAVHQIQQDNFEVALGMVNKLNEKSFSRCVTSYVEDLKIQALKIIFKQSIKDQDYKRASELARNLGKLSNTLQKILVLKLLKKGQIHLAHNIISEIDDEKVKEDLYYQIGLSLMEYENNYDLQLILNTNPAGHCLLKLGYGIVDWCYFNPNKIDTVVKWNSEYFKTETLLTPLYHRLIAWIYLLDERLNPLKKIGALIPNIAYSSSLLAEALFVIAHFQKKLGNSANQLIRQINLVIDISDFITNQTSYHYDDLDNWLLTIKDEDDRNFIESLANRVKKCKLTKVEFEKLVRDMISI
ncbi:ATP-binding protein [Bacillus wiedmannii]|uniref:ATP-binding protein n=1 Tax=Bacillus wiedmannii TaxID=1890302 RepID=UPI0021D10D90|nr:ATP-binding protein [Bacillus wiedmannii]MCU5578546.1 ATP-binding protein [Bacillus wiedmannii]